MTRAEWWVEIKRTADLKDWPQVETLLTIGVRETFITIQQAESVRGFIHLIHVMESHLQE